MYKHKKSGQIISQQNNPYIQYLSKFQELQHIPSDLGQLDSGVVFLDLFLLVKGFKIRSAFEEQPKTFAHRFTNLKILMESIEEYWNEKLQCEIESKDIDIVQIGKYGGLSEIEKILQLFIKTVAKSQDNHIFIERILQTSAETQTFLKNIIEETLISQPKESPRKQKQKRYIDRLLELDQENQKLQQIITTICDEKYQLELRLKSTSELLEEKTQEIQKLQIYINDETYTPQKKRLFNVPDTSDRKDHQIDSLNQQIVELNSRHEKETQELLAELDKMTYKANLYERAKGDLQLSEAIIASNKQLLEQAQAMEAKINHYKVDLINKDNTITLLKETVEKHQDKMNRMEKEQMNLKRQLEIKNIHIGELTSKIERISPKKSESPRNLFCQFPEIVNSQADAYIETNRALREQLERSKTIHQRTLQELQKYKSELQPLQNCEKENKRLRSLLLQEKTYKGQEIDVLVHALYHLRKRVQEGSFPQQRALKDKNL